MALRRAPIVGARGQTASVEVVEPNDRDLNPRTFSRDGDARLTVVPSRSREAA
jgi:hypothetical protein